MTKRLRAVLFLLVAAILVQMGGAGAQSSDGRDAPSVKQPCPECGVVYEVREIRREREAARTLKETNPPVGPQISLPLVNNEAERKAHVDVFGSRAMRESMTEVSYEVVIRFDDNRWRRIEVPDASGLQVGDRVHVHQNHIEPDDSDSR